jgi:hypothetical protein
MYRKIIGTVSAVMLASAALLGTAGTAVAATAHPGVVHPNPVCAQKCYY